LAYEFVRPTYEALLKRLETVEGRVRAILTFSATVSFAVPTFVAATLGIGKHEFTSPWFFLAMVVFLATGVIGLTSALSGEIRLVDPAKLYDEWLGLSEFEFKRRAIWVAGQDVQTNARLVNRLGTTANWMAAGLLVEIVLLLAWVAGL
jgi:hypothetical protein